MIVTVKMPAWLMGKTSPAAMAAASEARVEALHVAPVGPARAEENTMSFFSKLKSEISLLWKKAPAAEVAAASAVNYVVPFVESLDELVTPEWAPILNPILDKVKVGLSALKVTIQDAGTSPNLTSIIGSINTNLTALLAAAQVKDPAVATKIQTVATLVTGELSAISAG